MPSWRNKYARHLRYERTPRGFLVRAYTYAATRIRRSPGYEGLGICTRKEFYEAAWKDPEFLSLLAAWLESGCTKNLRPTPDRRDTTRGYEADNIRWLTYLDNVTSSRGFIAQQSARVGLCG